MSDEKSTADESSDVVKIPTTAPLVLVKNATVDNMAMIAHIEAYLKHLEANLDVFAAHEKAAVQQWLLGVKNRVRSLLSRIV
jgi:inorganic triphosphatase YgiF